MVGREGGLVLTPGAALGVYVHIPFCSALCHYCNFTRGLDNEPLRRAYVDALIADIGRSADGSPADTLYFGGGTPSLVAPDDLARLVDAWRASFQVVPAPEVTLEVNPETVTRAHAEAWREAGITRLSIGVQSFRSDELERLGRLHTVDGATRAVTEVRAAGFDNISLDLMMWLPQQTVDAWMESVEALVASRPEHASLYLLEVYPNAPLRDAMARAQWSQAADDEGAEMYVRAMTCLERAGYDQYEISSVARAGRRSRHNMKYWSDGEWLAFGCGAHGARHGTRWRNVSSTEDYVARVARGASVVAETFALTPRERLEEALFMGLRCSDGVDLATIGARYGVDVWDRYGHALFPFVQSGHVRYDGTRLQLSRDGMLVANEILTVFV